MTAQFDAWRRPLQLITMALCVLVIAPGRAESSTITAKSASLQDIESAIGSAREGDTVVIPRGTANWTATLAIAKGINLIGANVNATDDATVILDDVAVLRNGSATMIQASIKAGQSLRISGITFRGGSRITRLSGGAAIHIKDGASGGALAAPCDSLRIDHCHFDRLYQDGIRVSGWLYGVIDHCQWDTLETGNIAMGTISHSTWGGGANDQGNGSWAEPNYFGTEKSVFLEDNVINNNAKVVTNAALDAEYGARYVFRHNRVRNTQPVGHGTETGGYRGARASEVYNNTFDFTTLPLGGQLLRSGSLLIWGNTYTATNTGSHIRKLTVFREDGSSWRGGGASGNNPWDVNDTEGNGTNVPGHTPHLYLKGTHTGGNNCESLQVAGAAWTANQWAGYSVTNLKQVTRSGDHVCSYVTSNNTDTMSFAYGGNGPQLKFNTGDEFEVYRCLIALDQPGRGKGDLLRIRAQGDTVSYYNTITGGPAWPHQLLEPVYCWNNSVNGTMNSPVGTVASPYPTVRENRDYYNYAVPADGTQATGVGSGTLAERPIKCTPGVGYWATDQNTLYQCSPANTWNVYYKPYIYPHPLVNGQPIRTTSDSPPAATATPATKTTPGLTRGFGTKRKGVDNAKAKKIPGRPDRDG